MPINKRLCPFGLSVTHLFQPSSRLTYWPCLFVDEDIIYINYGCINLRVAIAHSYTVVAIGVLSWIKCGWLSSWRCHAQIKRVGVVDCWIMMTSRSNELITVPFPLKKKQGQIHITTPVVCGGGQVQRQKRPINRLDRKGDAKTARKRRISDVLPSDSRSNRDTDRPT